MKATVDGVDDLRRALDGVAKKKVKAGIRKGSRAGCKLIAARAKQIMPKGSGKSRKAVKVRAMPRSRTRVGTQVTALAAGSPAYYFPFVELGTKRIRARGYLKLAFVETKGEAAKAFVDGIKTEVVKS